MEQCFSKSFVETFQENIYTKHSIYEVDSVGTLIDYLNVSYEAGLNMMKTRSRVRYKRNASRIDQPDWWDGECSTAKGDRYRKRRQFSRSNYERYKQ